MQRKLFFIVMLLIVTFFWGVTFPIIKVALDYISPAPFLAIRFALASAMMLIFVKKSHNLLKPDNIKYGLIAGFLLFLGYFFQTVGLDYTTAAASGVITGLYVILLPIISFLYLKNKITRVDVLASGTAFFGLILLSYSPSGGFGNKIGDILTLLCAVVYAIQIVYVSKYSKSLDSYSFTFYQLFAVSIFSGLMIPFMPGTLFTLNDYVVFAIVFTAIFGSVFAYYVSTIALKFVDPTTAGVIFVGEPVFAAITSVLFLHEILGKFVIIGSVIMVGSILGITVERYVRERKSEHIPQELP